MQVLARLTEGATVKITVKVNGVATQEIDFKVALDTTPVTLKMVKEAFVGDENTIEGMEFIDTAEEKIVWFGAKDVKASSSENGKLKVTVPVIDAGIVKLNVQIGE